MDKTSLEVIHDLNIRRVLVMSDMHCGHRVGLTPPKFLSKSCGDKYYYVQIELWDQYKAILNRLKPIDTLIINADCLDGLGERTQGSELIVKDRFKQVDMAVECINMVEANKIVMTRGTPYHVGLGAEDWEDNIAKEVKAVKIGDHEWVDINGVTFDVKHKIGSSSIPHGKFTPIAKDRLWNFLWTEHEEQPKSDIIIRSHVHYFCYCGEDGWLSLTTPALQGMGSKFGARMCSGLVHFGVVYFDIKDNGDWSWGWDIVRGETQKAKAIQL